MIYVRLNTHITDHHRFAEAGAVARDLWTWGMLYAGKHETDGELPMAAVLASPWGASGRANVRVAAKLVEVGLWERTDAGFRVCRWSEQGNMTRAAIDAERAAAKERMAKRRESTKPPPPCSPEQIPNERRTNAFVPSSSFNSSGSSSSGESSERGPDPLGPAPDWFRRTVESISTSQVVDLRVAECWTAYCGHRLSKGERPDATHAAYWLTTVMVPKARDEAKADYRQRERDKRYADHTPKYEQPTPQRSAEIANELARRVAEQAKKGAA